MRPLIGTSWKMNLTASEAESYFRALVPLVDDLSDRDLSCSRRSPRCGSRVAS